MSIKLEKIPTILYECDSCGESNYRRTEQEELSDQDHRYLPPNMFHCPMCKRLICKKQTCSVEIRIETYYGQMNPSTRSSGQVTYICQDCEPEFRNMVSPLKLNFSMPPRVLYRPKLED